jgi:BirA family biotin operon repressor/biotin-[acetyl-CoA-carboxylase] ligase
MRELHINIPPFKKIISLSRVSSTMDVAYMLGRLGERNIVIKAEQQWAGRGKGENVWFSDDDSLTFSIILNGGFLYKPSLLPLLAGAIVKRGIISMTGIPIRLKWPNDVIFNRKKLGGILGEDWGKFIIIGIGLNINQKDFPYWLDTAISLYQIIGRDIEKDDILMSILKEFSLSLDTLVGEGITLIINEWKKSCDILGERVIVRYGLSQEEGIITEIASDGALVVELRDGREKKVYSTEELLVQGR